MTTRFDEPIDLSSLSLSDVRASLVWDYAGAQKWHLKVEYQGSSGPVSVTRPVTRLPKPTTYQIRRALIWCLTRELDDALRIGGRLVGPPPSETPEVTP